MQIHSPILSEKDKNVLLAAIDTKINDINEEEIQNQLDYANALEQYTEYIDNDETADEQINVQRAILQVFELNRKLYTAKNATYKAETNLVKA